MKKVLALIPVFIVLLNPSFSQETFPINGVKDTDKAVHAFTGATVHVSAERKLENATLLVQEGKVVQVGQGIAVPKGAVAHDVKGRHIFPSLIDAYSTYGVKQPEKEKKSGRGSGPQYEPAKAGAFTWNDALHPEADAAALFQPDAKKAEALRKLGFGGAVSVVQDGIARGKAAFVLTGNGSANDNLVQGDVTANYSFSKGTSTQDYPSSLMGSIALLRQAWLDAQWYATLTDHSKEQNLGLQAWNENQQLVQVFEAGDLLNVLRADKVGDEFGQQFIFVGSGKEYQRIDAMKATKGRFIIPLKFPDALDVEDPYDAQVANLSDMLHWELAPTNLEAMHSAGIPFALTLHGLEKEADFMPALRRSLEQGLDTAAALAALTSVPAKMFGLKNVGDLSTGSLANFIITTEHLFDEKNTVLEHWIKGKRYIIGPEPNEGLAGVYALKAGSYQAKVTLSEKDGKVSAKLMTNDTSGIDMGLKLESSLVTITLRTDKDAKAAFRLSGISEGRAFKGRGQNPDGDWLEWSMTWEKEEEKKDGDKKKDDKKDSVMGRVIYPFLAYGNAELPKAETVLVRNATVWTNEKDGILKETDVIISEGKIKAVGKGLAAPSGAKVVDGTGKHLASGIIDEHSHIAISRGVNEGAQAVTAEVSIADVVDSENINVYRQLAGGVTAAQLLHGSANPIGGQSALIKMHWGRLPEEMKIANAPKHIKFALGENVKQANWGERYSTRFPQTRMGVEQVYYDAFHRARAYRQEWSAFNAKKGGGAPRRDLEMEVLVEILDSKRFVTCHSYVQSEINMLMHVADSMGFVLNTFTHILEGYKVADKMVAHGANGSTFSDWWAYKMEVSDAIPYNAALMHRQGVNVGINSDDAEMGRRLNQEAAKGVKYGGMSEEEAWKMVTLNPARMLKLDGRTGSIKAGKDADVVLWSDSPLSIYARAEQTWVDGIRYWDGQQDAEARKALAQERNRLIQKMITAKKGGAKTARPVKGPERFYHCDSMGTEGEEHGCGGH
ncbi:MAG: amidohydrolase family protein [Flavobacteriales bacterium]|nr:amidohydrolase family protein [Flavobacteriales bacterium]